MLLCAVVAFAACEQIYVDVVSDIAAGDRCLSVSFEGQDTRIQLNEAQKTVWTDGDILSVFYRSTVNEEWQFKGKTGDRTGDIVPVDNTLNPPYTHNRVVVIYPYNENYYLNTETYSIEASLPAVQNYLKDSYGTNGNIMVSSSDYKQVSLKSVCGWLKVQLTGDGEVVKSITLRGNNGEQVAGEIHINTSDATCVVASASGDAGESEVGGTLVRPGTILTEVTLDCGDGVTLGEEATAFYIALPPQTFEKGFSVSVECADGSVMNKATTKSVTISRNTIQPFSALEYSGVVAMPNNQIRYTSPYKISFSATADFGATLVSHEWDSESGRGVMIFDGDVTQIPASSFYGDKLTEMHLPASITKIGKTAFDYCSDLTSVFIYDLVAWCNVEIEGSASTSPLYYGDLYINGELVTDLVIPYGITELKDNVFTGCNLLQSVHIPDSVTSIGRCAFHNCTKVSSIDIPNSVTFIGEQAFSNWHSLESVHIPDSVTVIEDGAFYVCKKIREFTGKYAEDGGKCLVYNGRLIDFADACGDTSYTIPEGVTAIGAYAFRSSKLVNVVIPEGVTEIGSWAFGYNESMESITIPTTLKRVGDTAFYICKKNKRVYIEDLAAWCEIEFDDSYTPLNDNGYLYVNNTCVTKLDIPANTTKIGDYAFAYFDNFESVNIPEGVESIGTYSFFMCENLKSVSLPNSVKSIGDSAFSLCYKLADINIPDGLTAISASMLYKCYSLTEVHIPASVCSIGEAAFYDCDSLKDVYCYASAPASTPYGYYSYWNAFEGCPSDLKIYVYDEFVDAYKSAWSRYKDYIVGFGNYPNATTSFIYYTTTDEQIVEPVSLSIKSNTYSNGVGVIEVYGELAIISSGAFENCTTLTSINLPNSVSIIDRIAFMGCTNLASCDLPDSLVELGNNVFEGCSKLTTMTLPATMRSIGKSAFYECSGMKTLYCKSITPPTLGVSALSRTGSCKFYVPTQSLEEYKTTSYWKSYASRINGYDFDVNEVAE